MADSDGFPDAHCPGCQQLRKVLKDLVVLNNMTLNPALENYLDLYKRYKRGDDLTDV